MLIRQTRGFTLVELTITVVALGVLSIFALYNYQANSLRAKTFSTKATMSDVLVAAEDYALAYDGVFPASSAILAEYAVNQPRYARKINAYDKQSLWMTLNRGQAGDIFYHALLDTTGACIGYRIEARGTDDWLPTILERRPRDDTF